MGNFILPSMILIAGLLVGCQTPKLQEYEKINVGIEKHDVLELVGSPNTTERDDGTDRWIYWLYEKDVPVRLTKEVHFKEGVVTYKGDPIPPIISAEQQDSINLRQDIELARRQPINAKPGRYKPNSFPMAQ